MKPLYSIALALCVAFTIGCGDSEKKDEKKSSATDGTSQVSVDTSCEKCDGDCSCSTAKCDKCEGDCSCSTAAKCDKCEGDCQCSTAAKCDKCEGECKCATAAKCDKCEGECQCSKEETAKN